MDDAAQGEVTRGAAVVLVVPEWHGQGLSRDLDARVAEAKGLALAIGLDVVAVHPLRLRQTRAATLIGAGQIEAIEPYAVDVASGVEAEPGIKDPATLEAFFAAVGGATVPSAS